MAHPADFDGWRDRARVLLTQEVPPEEIVWLADPDVGDLFSSSVKAPADTSAAGESPRLARAVSEKPCRVPGAFLNLAKYVACHRDTDRFALLYRVLWRMQHGEAALLRNSCDDDVCRLDRLRGAVSRDRHKMTAFVRFRQLPDVRVSPDSVSNDHYIAWFEPDHHILRLTSDFFIKRFSNMVWSIYTPAESAHWNGSALVFSEGAVKDSMPDAENMEALWRTYFANIYNPARLRVKAMQSEMPVKYWKNLPEAPLIAELIHESDSRTQQMIDQPATQPPKFSAKAEYTRGPSALPKMTGSIDSVADLATAIDRCAQCAHALKATQAVPGCLASSATGGIARRLIQSNGGKDERAHSISPGLVMLVGEQPGDREDVSGKPFMGPAGQLLREIMAELQLDLDAIYLTNAVKHFNYMPRGKRRIHKRPPESAIQQCRSWLLHEIRLLQPVRIVALGVTAAKALTGHTVKMGDVRGQWTSFGNTVPLMITAHPSSVLRGNDQKSRSAAREMLRKDLEVAFST